MGDWTSSSLLDFLVDWIMEDIEKVYGELLDHFEGRLPSPEHEPKRFAYFVKMFKYYKYRQGQKPKQ